MQIANFHNCPPTIEFLIQKEVSINKNKMALVHQMNSQLKKGHLCKKKATPKNIKQFQN